jgi:hypothetical protein
MTSESAHCRTSRPEGAISIRNGARRWMRGRVSSCAAAGPATPAIATASTANPVIDMRMVCPPIEHATVSHHGAGVNLAL